MALGAARLAGGDPADAASAYEAAVALDPSGGRANRPRERPAGRRRASGRGSRGVGGARHKPELSRRLVPARRGAPSPLQDRRGDHRARARGRARSPPRRGLSRPRRALRGAGKGRARGGGLGLRPCARSVPGRGARQPRLGLSARRRAEPAEKHSRQALALDPSRVAPHQKLASLLDGKDGRPRQSATASRPMPGRNLFVETAPGPAPTGPHADDRRKRQHAGRRLMPRDRISRLRWVTEYEREDQPRTCPPYDVVFNAIGDLDLAEPTSAPMRRFLDQCRQPVLNPPDKIMRTRRDRMPGLLGGIGRRRPCRGGDIPRRGRSEKMDLAPRSARPVLSRPLLLRPVGAARRRGSGGSNRSTALEGAPPIGDLYATTYHDYRSADGSIGNTASSTSTDELIPTIWRSRATGWCTTRAPAWAKTRRRRAEEERFLDAPSAAVGRREWRPSPPSANGSTGLRRHRLRHARRRPRTGVRGQRHHARARGGADGAFAYKNRGVAAIRAAFEAMLRAAAKPPRSPEPRCSRRRC